MITDGVLVVQIDSDAHPASNWRVRSDWCFTSGRHVGLARLIVPLIAAALYPGFLRDAIVFASAAMIGRRLIFPITTAL